MMAAFLGSTSWVGHRAALQSCGQRQQPRAALRRHRTGVFAAAADTNNNNAWDTLSVDELQEWEVRALAGPLW